MEFQSFTDFISYPVMNFFWQDDRSEINILKTDNYKNLSVFSISHFYKSRLVLQEITA